jgi:uncharacterized membrane protein YgcG
MARSLPVLAGLLLALSLGAAAFAAGEEPLDGVRLVALSPGEGCAAVAGPGSELVVVRAGDRLPGAKAEVVEVLADRLVVDVLGDVDGDDDGDAEAERERAWIFPPRRPGGRTRVKLLRRRPPRDATPAVPIAAKPLTPGAVPAGGRVVRAPGARGSGGAKTGGGAGSDDSSGGDSAGGDSAGGDSDGGGAGDPPSPSPEGGR